MNLKHVNYAIRIMERAKKQNSVNMVDWQSNGLENAADINKVACTTSKLHKCGNKACFAGHIAVSYEFKRTGGLCSSYGSPMYENSEGEHAISKWLDISPNLARSFVFGDKFYTHSDYYIPKYEFSNFYHKMWTDVNAQDVLDKLYMLRDGTLQ